MNIEETNRLLTVLQQIDKRIIDDPTVIVWQEVLHDLPLDDCVRAATVHYRESTEYLMPAHIVAGARAIQRERMRAERDHERELARIADEAIERGPLRDRSPEVQALIAEIRDRLPASDPDVMTFGHGYWRRVREDRERSERAERAEPNPHYDPTALGRLAKMVPEP